MPRVYCLHNKNIEREKKMEQKAESFATQFVC